MSYERMVGVCDWLIWIGIVSVCDVYLESALLLDVCVCSWSPAIRFGT